MLEEHPTDLLQVLASQLAVPDGKHLYVLAYAHARTTQPTPQILELLRQLLLLDVKWANVLERLANNNLEMVFAAFQNNFLVFRSFLQQCFSRNYEAAIQHIHDSLLCLMKMNGPTLILPEIIFETLSLYLVESIDRKMQFLSSFFQNEPASFMELHLAHSKELIKCLIVLSQKYTSFERKNSMSLNDPLFQQRYCQFHLLLCKAFTLYISDSLNTTPEMMEVLCQLTNRHQMYELHRSNMDTLFQICEAGLTIFNREVRQKFQHDPEEILNYENDLMEKQRSNTVGSQAAKLLQHLCKHIDGLLANTFRRIVSVLTSIYKGDGQNPSIERAEVLYLQLLVINKQLRQRRDLTEELTQFLGDNSSSVFMIHDQQPILNYRLIRLIQIYINVLPSREFESVMMFLLGCLNSPNKGFVLQVNESLCNLVEDKGVQREMSDCMVVLAPTLIGLISSVSTRNYFDLLNLCLKHFKCLSERFCMRFVESLSSKLHVEVRKCWESQQKISQVVVSAYNCLISILKYKDILDDMYDEIEPFLLQHAQYLENPNTIQFEDKILDMTTIVVETGKYLTTFVIVCLKSAKGVYAKNKDLDYIFQLFYAICHSAKTCALSMPESIAFMTLVTRSFIVEQDIAQMSTQAYYRGCLLLQILIQTFEESFSNEHLRQDLVQELLQILGDKTKPHKYIKSALISLYYIRPFPLELQFDDLSDKYTNKMRNLYLTVRLRENPSGENLVELLNYLQKYISLYLFTGKKEQLHEEENYDQQEFNTLSIPFEEIDDLMVTHEVLKWLQKEKKIDFLELSGSQSATLELSMRVEWCNNRMRQVYKFLKA